MPTLGRCAVVKEADSLHELYSGDDEDDNDEDDEDDKEDNDEE